MTVVVNVYERSYKFYYTKSPVKRIEKNLPSKALLLCIFVAGEVLNCNGRIKDRPTFCVHSVIFYDRIWMAAELSWDYYMNPRPDKAALIQVFRHALDDFHLSWLAASAWRQCP